MDNRGLSTVVGYTMILGIIALLTTGLVVSMGGFVDGHTDDTTHSTFEVVSNTLAADVDTADRLVQSTEHPDTIAVTASLPERVAGNEYEIDIETPEHGYSVITFQSDRADVFATVTVRTETTVTPTTVEGGDLRIQYDVENDSLEVQDE